MKKSTKITLISAAILMVAGIGFTITGVGLGADTEGEKLTERFKKMGFAIGTSHKVFWDHEDWDDDWEDAMQAKEDNGDGNRIYEFDGIASIEMELRSDELFIEKGDGDGIRVEIENDKKNQIRLKQHSDRLDIKSINFTNGRTIKIYLPDSITFEDIEVELDAGTALLRPDIQTEQFSCSIGAGEWISEGTLTTEKAEIEVGAGSVEFRSLDAKDIQGECGLGSMILKLKGRQEDYSYYAECGMGSLKIGNDELSGMAGEHSNHPEGATRKLEAECGLGELEIEFLD